MIRNYLQASNAMSKIAGLKDGKNFCQSFHCILNTTAKLN